MCCKCLGMQNKQHKAGQCSPGTTQAAADVLLQRRQGLHMHTFKMGSRADPQPHPSSTICCGGSWTVKTGNSSSRYLANHTRCSLLLNICTPEQSPVPHV